MAKVSLLAGTTSYIARVFIQDSSVTTGAGLSGLTSSSVASWKIYAARDDDGNAVAVGVALAAGTRGTWSSGGFVEKDATNEKGVYEIGIPNAALAAGSKSVLLYLSGATNMVPLVLEIELTAVNNQSANAFITGINSLAPPTRWNVMLIDASGRVDLGSWLGTAVTLSSGVPDVNLKTITVGIIAAASFAARALDDAFNAPTSGMSTAGSIGKRIVDYLTGDIYLRLGAPAGASVSADIAAVKSDSGAVKTQTDKLAFTVPNQVDVNVLDWKSATAPAMSGDAFSRLGAPAGASVSADVAALQADTTNMKSRLPAALVGGRMDSYLGATAVGVIDAAALASSADNAIAAAVLAAAVDGTVTLKQLLQIVGAAVAGKTSGAGTTTITFRNVSDTVNAIVATDDGVGNRSTITYTFT